MDAKKSTTKPGVKTRVVASRYLSNTDSSASHAAASKKPTTTAPSLKPATALKRTLTLKPLSHAPPPTAAVPPPKTAVGKSADKTTTVVGNSLKPAVVAPPKKQVQSSRVPSPPVPTSTNTTLKQTPPTSNNTTVTVTDDHLELLRIQLLQYRYLQQQSERAHQQQRQHAQEQIARVWLQVRQLEQHVSEEEVEIRQQQRLQQISQQLQQQLGYLRECVATLRTFEPAFEQWSDQVLALAERFPAKNIAMSDLQPVYALVEECDQLVREHIQPKVHESMRKETATLLEASHDTRHARDEYFARVNVCTQQCVAIAETTSAQRIYQVAKWI